MSRSVVRVGVAAFAVVVAALFGLATYTRSAGMHELEVVRVPAGWSTRTIIGGGDYNPETAFRIWTADHRMADQADEQSLSVYSAALTASGWTWHDTCYSRHEYNYDISNGCWRKTEYSLIARVETRSASVVVTMYRDRWLT